LVAGITLGARGFGFYSVAESGITPVMEVLSYLVPGLLIILFGFLAVSGRALTIPKAWAQLNDRLLRGGERKAGTFQGTGQESAGNRHDDLSSQLCRAISSSVTVDVSHLLPGHSGGHPSGRFQRIGPAALYGLPITRWRLGLLISALRVPTMLQAGIPFVVLIASIATLLQLNRKYELVVTRAAGISAWQFLAPLIIANLLIGLMCGRRPQHILQHPRCSGPKHHVVEQQSWLPAIQTIRAMAKAAHWKG
jgi:hypothetical protein